MTQHIAPQVPVLIQSMMGYEVEAIVPVVERAIDLLDPSVLAAIRRKGEKGMIVLKPNWIQESHEYNAEAWEAVITNPTLLLATIQVLVRRLQGAGTRIVLCDGPHTYANFDSIVARGGLKERLSRMVLEGVKLELVDLRREVWRRKDQVVVERMKNSEDPRGYVALNLGKDSLFFAHKGEEIRDATKSKSGENRTTPFPNHIDYMPPSDGFSAYFVTNIQFGMRNK